MLNKLAVPFGFLRLRNRALSLVNYAVLPLMAAAITALFLTMPGSEFFGPDGFLDKLISLTSALTGFYIAAIVYVQSVINPHLDNELAYSIVQAKDDDDKYFTVTRRELCVIIFSYAAAMSIIFCIIAAIFVAISKSKVFFSVMDFSIYYKVVNLRTLCMFIFSYIAVSILFCTLISLFYIVSGINKRY